MLSPSSSLADVRAFQRTHLSHIGKPLRVDGDVGAQTVWALDFDTISPARRAIIQSAQVWIGLSESPPGSNDDPAGTIRGWLTRCGARPGDPWCASFVSKCIGTVAIPGAQVLGRHFPAVTMPFAGDIFWFPTSPVFGHCGIVIGVGAHEVMTLEGNCQNAVQCVRRARDQLRFSRVIADASGTCPGVVPTAPFMATNAAGTR
jgi:hypothetical protein